MEKEKKQQEMFMKFGFFEKQIKQINQQLEAIGQALFDLNNLYLDLDKIKDNQEIIASIGKGIFIRGKTTSKKLMVDIGEGKIIEKTIPETKDLLKNQIQKLDKIKEELEDNLEKINLELDEVVKESQN